MTQPKLMYEFKGFHGCQSRCEYEVHALEDGGSLLVLTEIEDNPGTSVTNMAEHLATDICRKENISPQGLVVVEHYPARGTWVAETFDLVTFDFDWRQGRFTNPRWQRLDRDRYTALVAGAGPVPLRKGGE